MLRSEGKNKKAGTAVHGYVWGNPTGYGGTTSHWGREPERAVSLHPLRILSCCPFLGWPGKGGMGQDEMQGLDAQGMSAGEGKLWHSTYGAGAQIKRLQWSNNKGMGELIVSP